MIQLLARVFIRDYKNYEDPRVRAAYGTLCSGTAIVLNIILSAAKFVVGILAGSVSISADAANNLSDAGSSLIILLGFRFAGKAPHPDHPFGHGRIEYVTGFLVAAIILAAGVQAARSAVERIFHPEDLEVTWAAVIVLVLSILVKVYMGYFNRRLGRKLRSETMLMAGRDALNDTVSTGLALLCLVLYRVSGWNLDAYAGLVVAFLILRTGFQGGKETLSQLLGKKPEPETVKKIEEIVMSFPEILGIHDMVIHDYGPGRFHVSLHAEVDGSGDIYALHDAIDRATLELEEKLHCHGVIHMDPVDIRDERVAALREETESCLRELDPQLQMHDFRVVPGPSKTNLIFDVVAPFGYRLTDEELRRAIQERVQECQPQCQCIIQVDKAYA